MVLKTTNLFSNKNFRRVVLFALVSYFLYLVGASFAKWQEGQIGTLFKPLVSNTAQVSYVL